MRRRSYSHRDVIDELTVTVGRIREKVRWAVLVSQPLRDTVQAISVHTTEA